MPICGVLGGAPAEIAYTADARLLFDYFFPDVLPGTVFEVPELTAEEINALSEYAAFAALQGLMSPTQPTAQWLNTSSVPYVPGIPQTPLAIAKSAATIAYFSLTYTNDFLARVGWRVPYDNTETVYSGSADDAMLNASVPRFSSDPAAINFFERNYETSGDIRIPVLSLHTLWNMQGAYDAEIAYTDAQVGRLLDALEQDGRLDDTLVVVLGDHGEMLGEHGEQTHGFFIYEAATHVPLIVAGPGVPARAVPDQVRLVDVMPTALALLGVPVPKAVQGVNLLPLSRGETLDLVAYSESWYPRYHYGWSELRSIQDGRFKFIRAPRPELYDLQKDPAEETDRATDHAARTHTMARALEALEARTAGSGTQEGPRLVDAETEERLAALGYVGGSISRRNLEERPRGDPKDKIGLYNLLKQAASASTEGRPDEAIAKVRQALEVDPEIVEAYMLLGNFLKKAKKPAEAIAAYKQALAKDDEHQGALFALAVAYKDQGRLDEAQMGFERARELDPKNGKVLWQLADLHMLQGDPQKAQAVIKDALAHKVNEPRFLLKLGESQIEAKQLTEAEQSLKAALQEKPDLDQANFSLGLVYEGTGRTDLAIAAYEAEIRGNEKAYRACFNLASLLQKQGRGDEATALFRKSVEIQPDFGTGQLYLAKALLDRGDLKNAEEWARKGLTHRPDPRIAPLGHYVLADVYSRQGRTKDADREVAAAKRMQRGG